MQNTIADTLQLRDIAMATIFWLSMGCTLAPPVDYDWTVHVRRRCDLMSNYFDHLLLQQYRSILSYTTDKTKNSEIRQLD